MLRMCKLPVLNLVSVHVCWDLEVGPNWLVHSMFSTLTDRQTDGTECLTPLAPTQRRVIISQSHYLNNLVQRLPSWPVILSSSKPKQNNSQWLIFLHTCTCTRIWLTCTGTCTTQRFAMDSFVQKVPQPKTGLAIRALCTSCSDT